MVITLVPVPGRYPPLAIVLAAAAAELWRVLAAPPPPTLLRLFSDGALQVTRGTGEVTTTDLAGGLFAPAFAIITWREAGSRGPRCRVLVLRRDNPDSWRRARLIWRWAPQRVPRRIGVDSARPGSAHGAQDSTELSPKPRVYGGDRGRAGHD